MGRSNASLICVGTEMLSAASAADPDSSASRLGGASVGGGACTISFTCGCTAENSAVGSGTSVSSAGTACGASCVGRTAALPVSFVVSSKVRRSSRAVGCLSPPRPSFPAAKANTAFCCSRRFCESSRIFISGETRRFSKAPRTA